MIEFTLISQDSSGLRVEMKFSQASLYEILPNLKGFLQASGFSLNGELEIVKEEE